MHVCCLQGYSRKIAMLSQSPCGSPCRSPWRLTGASSWGHALFSESQRETESGFGGSGIAAEFRFTEAC